MTIALPALTGPMDWSVAVRDLDGGEVLAQFQPDRVLHTASIGKLFVLLRAARLLVDGSVHPDRLLRPGADDLVADSGLLHLARRPEVRFADACLLVAAVSDNLATNLLIEALGLDSIQQVARDLGYRDSTILDKVRTERTSDLPPTLSVSRADELSDLARRLALGTAIDPATSALVNGWLATDVDTSMVAGAFGIDPLAHQEADGGWLVRHKTGSISTARADVGWVRRAPDGPGVAYAVLVNWPADPRPEPRRQVLRVMREVGEAIRLHLVCDDGAEAVQ